jgi:hypothetical protein
MRGNLPWAVEMTDQLVLDSPGEWSGESVYDSLPEHPHCLRTSDLKRTYRLDLKLLE